MATRYLRPGWFTTNAFNRMIAGLTRVGISVLGARSQDGALADHPGEPPHP